MSQAPPSRMSSRRPRARRLLAGVLVLACGLACGTGSDPYNFGVVDEGRLYRSGRLSPEAMERVIREHGIRTVVDLGSWDTDYDRSAEVSLAVERAGASRYAIRMLGDGRANPNGYVAVLRILTDPEQQPVLVQCAGGSERTGTAVTLYRHVAQGQPYQQAYRESFEHGHVPEDYGWIAYLTDWAGEIEAAYREGRWIPGLPPVEARPGERVDARPAPGQWVPPEYPVASGTAPNPAPAPR